MPFSTGLPYRGKYRYFIDPADPSVAILQEFVEAKPAEFKTISKMRFRNTTVNQVMFHGNYTLTVTADNRFYMGIIAEDGTKVYNQCLLAMPVGPAVPIILVNGCHVVVSQFDTGVFSRNRPDITIYYDKNYNVCFKSCPKSGLDRYWQISKTLVWPKLTIESEIIENTLVTDV